MSPRELAVDGLLGLGVGIELLCAVGLVVFRGPFERLHLTGPANGLGALAIWWHRPRAEAPVLPGR